MESTVLKKRLNTFKTSEGRLQNVSDDVIMSVLRAWENWTGTTADLYRELGLTKMQMVILIKKAKKLVKSGVMTESDFQEVTSDSVEDSSSNQVPCSGIEMIWGKDKIIKFRKVDELVDFLKKVA